jgi:hypothetical protein
MKICSKCKIEKELNEFHKQGKYFHSECKRCLYESNKKSKLKNKKSAAEYAKKYRSENEKEIKIYEKNYKLKNKDKITIQSKENYQENIEKRRWSRIKRIYGITEKEYNEMLNNQNNVCSICLQSERRKAHNGNVCNLSIDHNHKTGKIRGLLCHDCNVAIGHFDDNSETLERAIKYLKNN